MTNNLVRKIASIVSLPLAIYGCNFTEINTEYSKTLEEEAVVVETVYNPSTHRSELQLVPTVDFDGDITLSFENVNIDIPAKYAVFFKCQHGKFISEGTDQRHKDLWGSLSENDEVIVQYREMYKNTYKDIDDDGKKDLIESHLISYDFLDAQRKRKDLPLEMPK